MIGTPCSGPAAAPRASAASAASASRERRLEARRHHRVERGIHASRCARCRRRRPRAPTPASPGSRARSRRRRRAEVQAQPPATKLRSSSAPSEKCRYMPLKQSRQRVECANARARAGAPHLLAEGAVLEELVVRPAARVVLGAVHFHERHGARGAIAPHAIAVGVADQDALHLRVGADQVEERHRVLGQQADRVRVRVALLGRHRLVVHQQQRRDRRLARLRQRRVQPGEAVAVEHAVVIAGLGRLEQHQPPAAERRRCAARAAARATRSRRPRRRRCGGRSSRDCRGTRGAARGTSRKASRAKPNCSGRPRSAMSPFTTTASTPAALISAIASSFMIRQYGTSVSSARINGKPLGGVAVLVIGGELAAEARLAEVQVVQRREGRRAARAAASAACARGRGSSGPGCGCRGAVDFDRDVVLGVRVETLDAHQPRRGVAFAAGAQLAVEQQRAPAHRLGRRRPRRGRRASACSP